MSLSAINSQSQVKNDELKRRLLECVELEKNNFLKLAEVFYNNETRDNKNCIQLCEAVIGTIDKLLASGEWDNSLFLHNTVKPLKKIREDALQLLEQINDTHQVKDYVLPEIAEDSIKLFISIFQSDAHNLRKWELQLKSISAHLMGRPVYQNEEDVRKAIRMKVAQISEAYIMVCVKKEAIYSESHHPIRKDRSGSPLVTLKPGAVTPESILEFVQQDKRYYFIKGKLVEA